MIEIVNIHKRFGRVPVFQGLTLALAPGRVTALIGPNGSGKSTLLKMILGLARPDRGHIRVDGTIVNGSGAYRSLLGYMPQTPRFPDNLEVREVLDLVSALRGSPPAVDDALIDAFDLTRDLPRPVRVLSGGTRQKVSALLALRYHPRLLILDEPTAGLDPVAARTLKDAILAARERETTVLVASHVLAELEELAQDVICLLDGRAWFAGPVTDLLTRTGQRTLERAVIQAMSSAA